MVPYSIPFHYEEETFRILQIVWLNNFDEYLMIFSFNNAVGRISISYMSTCNRQENQLTLTYTLNLHFFTGWPLNGDSNILI